MVGFVTAFRNEEVGFVGGLLVVNQLGRPLEFHATTPVRPTRAHEILYGPTLSSFVMGERIAGTLIDHVKSNLSAVLTDVPEIAAGLPESRMHPIVVSSEQAGHSPQVSVTSIDQLRLSGWLFETVARRPIDGYREALEAMRIEDWQEPFERIREALDEAQRSVRAATPRRVGEAA
ncbi:MAG: hypothetical protein KDA83_05565 [Planctomycetales bacterium]|nr:hypothetical protein [Planctomycetales bacterium]